MAYRTFSSDTFGSRLTKWVRQLLIANVAVFAILLVARLAFGVRLAEYLAFRPVDLLTRPWTPLTYMFTHEGVLHLVFNMLGLFFFGPVLEERWGSKAFLRFYLLCGFAGALLSVAFPNQAIEGASAAVFGIMVAFAVYWPDSPIYVWGVFPIKAKWLVLALVAVNLLSLPDSRSSGTAHLAHLGGAIAAFAYLKSPYAPSAFGEVYSPRKKKKPHPRPTVRRGWRDLFRRRRPEALKATPNPKPRPAPRTVPAHHRDQDDVDRILDKISEAGIESLTPEERRRLEDASRRLGTS